MDPACAQEIGCHLHFFVLQQNYADHRLVRAETYDLCGQDMLLAGLQRARLLHPDSKYNQGTCDQCHARVFVCLGLRACV